MPGHSHHCSALPITHSILLRNASDSQLMLNACSCTKLLKSIWIVFSPIIRPDNLYFVVRLIFNTSFKLPKKSQLLLTLLQKINQPIMVKSSINRMKYLLPFKDKLFIGPYTSICTSCIFSDALLAGFVGNDNLFCFSNWIVQTHHHAHELVANSK